MNENSVHVGYNAPAFVIVTGDIFPTINRSKKTCKLLHQYKEKKTGTTIFFILVHYNYTTGNFFITNYLQNIPPVQF